MRSQSEVVKVSPRLSSLNFRTACSYSVLRVGHRRPTEIRPSRAAAGLSCLLLFSKLVASRAKNRVDVLSSEDIAELLDDLQKRMDRCKVMFEQYFLGIQKTAPSQLQIELERRIRKLTQTHISNTGLRFRFTTLSQKFASYNTYWRRTMRQIENGTYIRDIVKVGREAVRLGKDVPDELLAKMPKRMRERILRDRDQVRERQERTVNQEQALRASGKVRENRAGNVHRLDEADLLEDLDLDSIFAGMMDEKVASEASDIRAARRKAEIDTDVEQLLLGSQPHSALTEDTVEERAFARPAPPARAKPRVPPPQRTPQPPPGTPASKPPPGMSVAESQALYKRYKKARELVGENTSNLSYDRLMRSLNKQAPKILQDHDAKGVSFNVVVKGDRVVLKAKPKK